MKILVSNKKAYFDFEIIEVFEAGISLKGTEVKSLRNSDGSLKEAYVQIKKNEVWLLNSYIAPYKFGNKMNHKERRERKLLMKKKEIFKLKKISKEKSYTIVPLSIYIKNGFLKIKIALAKGKRKYEKREKIKEKEEQRKIAQILKS